MAYQVSGTRERMLSGPGTVSVIVEVQAGLAIFRVRLQGAAREDDELLTQPDVRTNGAQIARCPTRANSFGLMSSLAGNTVKEGATQSYHNAKHQHVPMTIELHTHLPPHQTSETSTCPNDY